MATTHDCAVQPLPPGVDRWNWGAFLLNWIWGIGNNTFVALLALVPFVNLVMVFVLGAKGGEWAWRNKRWESVDEFRRVQRNWAIAGVIVWLAVLGLLFAVFFSVMAAIRGSDVYRLSVERLEENVLAMKVLGAPVEAGFPLGSMRISGPSGEAELSIPVKGSRSTGTLHLQATRAMGTWRIDRLELEIDGSGERIDLGPGTSL